MACLGALACNQDLTTHLPIAPDPVDVPTECLGVAIPPGVDAIGCYGRELALLGTENAEAVVVTDHLQPMAAIQSVDRNGRRTKLADVSYEGFEGTLYAPHFHLTTGVVLQRLGDRASAVRRYDLATGAATTHAISTTAPPYQLAFADANTGYLATGDGLVHLDLASGETTAIALDAYPFTITVAAADGMLLASAISTREGHGDVGDASAYQIARLEATRWRPLFVGHRIHQVIAIDNEYVWTDGGDFVEAVYRGPQMGGESQALAFIGGDNNNAGLGGPWRVGRDIYYAYQDDGRLWRVSLDGGAPNLVLDAARITGVVELNRRPLASIQLESGTWVLGYLR